MDTWIMSKTRCSRRRQISPQCRHLANWTKMCVVFDSCLFPVLYENMTSSTKPEVHSISQCHQRRTESWPRITCIENVVKLGRVVFWDTQADIPANRHTDTLIAILSNHTGGEVTMDASLSSGLFAGEILLTYS